MDMPALIMTTNSNIPVATKTDGRFLENSAMTSMGTGVGVGVKVVVAVALGAVVGVSVGDGMGVGGTGAGVYVSVAVGTSDSAVGMETVRVSVIPSTAPLVGKSPSPTVIGTDMVKGT